MVSLVDWS